MSKYNKFIAGTIAALSVLSVAGAAAVVPAGAATSAELQAQIQALLAQIAALQAQLGTGTNANCFVFARSLTLGSNGEDVRALQVWLNSNGYVVATAGPGSKGNETTYFGGLTRTALAKYQASAGISPAVGYFGPITRAKVNAVCNVSTGGGNTGGGTGTTTSTDTTLHGGEATLINFDASSGDNTTVNEGQSNAKIMNVRFTVNDGDIRLDRADVAVKANSGVTETKPWKVFSTIAVWDGSTKLASVDATDSSLWDEDTSTSPKTYTIRINGLNDIIRQNATANLTVSGTLQNGINGVDTNTSANWQMWIPDNGIRGRDAAGVDQTIGKTSDKITFTLQQQGQSEKLTINESSSNPASSVIDVDKNTTTDWTTVLAFDMTAANHDIQLNSIPVTVHTGSAGYSTVVTDARLMIGSKTYNNITTVGSTTTNATSTFTFNKGEIVIPSGSTQTAKLQLRFAATTGGTPYANGETVQAEANSADVLAADAEGANTLSGTSQLKGSAIGNTHSLFESGLMVERVGTGTAVSPVGAVENRADYSIKFKVTAFDNDFYIAKAVDRAAAATSSTGVSFLLQQSDDTTYATGTTTGSLTADSAFAGDTGTVYKVSSGSGRTFTLNVSLTNTSTSAFVKAQLTKIQFSTSSDGITNALMLSTNGSTGVLKDYETPAVFVAAADAP
jgi:hypothetical protein